MTRSIIAATLALAVGACATARRGDSETPVVPLSLENNYLMTTRCQRAGKWTETVDDINDLGGNVLLDYGTAVQSQAIQYQTYTYSAIPNVRAFRCPKAVLQQLGVAAQ